MVDVTRVVAAKGEVTYQTDAEPTLADNALLTRNYSIVPLEVDQLQRNFDNRRYGATRGKPVNRRMRSSYEIELGFAPNGAAGTPPPWMQVLAACGMAPPQINAGQDATLRFAGPGLTAGSITEYSWVDDQLRKMVGARGTFSLDFTAGQVPFASVQMTGLVPAAGGRSTNVPGDADFTDWSEPLEVNDINTLLTVDGYAAVTRSLTVDAGVSINLRNLIGARYVRSGNHQTTGRLLIEAPTIAAKDYLATLSTGDLIAINMVHGVVAGGRVNVRGDKVQITGITESNEDDILMFSLDLLFTTDGGSDDLVIISD